MYTIISKFARTVISLACFVTLSSQYAVAISPDTNLPIEIESDRATLNDETGVSQYFGNVIISQGESRLEADSISVNSLDRRITSIKAIGSPAHFVQQDEHNLNTHGYGDVIIYVSSNNILRFLGNARFVQHENSFEGEQTEYDIAAKAIKAKGDETVGTRVRIQYKPLSLPTDLDKPTEENLLENATDTNENP